MIFNYGSSFEEWCEEEGYDWDNLLNEEVLLQKSYSRILQFYIANDNGSYAQVRAYHSEMEGLHDIEILAEGLTRHVEQIMTERVFYK